MTTISDLDAKAKEERLNNIIANGPLFTIPSPAHVTFKRKTIENLFEENFKEPERLISPWLPEAGVALIHAKAGTGKTLFAMTAAYALAIGKDFLHWKISKPRRVLYLDAEMTPIDCRKNFRNIGTMYGPEFDPKDNLEIINYFWQDDLELNLSDLNQQNAIIELIKEKKFEVLVIDNISMLCPEFRENESHSWSPMQCFENRVKKAGCSIIRIMHTGKTGMVRATSKVFDAVNTTIYLERMNDDDEELRADFKVKFEKARGFHGLDTRPVVMSLKQDGEAYYWDCETADISNAERIIDLIKEGICVSDIAQELNLSKSVVSRHIKRAVLNFRLSQSQVDAANKQGRRY